MTGLPGWEDDLGADPATGEIPEETPPPAGEAATLVQAIIANPEALALLKQALGIEEQEKDKNDELPVFAASSEFVEEFVVRVFRKHLTSSRMKWCEQWWEHPEARFAVDALWERWEVERRHRGGMAHWLTLYGWPIMDRLTNAETSPFDGCQHTTSEKDAEHNPAQGRLPIGIPPDELFTRVPTKSNPHPED